MDMHLDHLYRETTQWPASVAFWQRLGFAFQERWGEEPHRAGRLASGGAMVVLAEVADGADLAEAPFFEVSDVDEFSGKADAPVIDTHWATRMVTVTDPDGRTYHFEAKDPG